MQTITETEIKSETKPETKTVSLAATVQAITKNIMVEKGKALTNLYDLMIEQIEPPLFEEVLKHCQYRQAKAARYLGLSRGTFRSRLVHYFGSLYCGKRQETEG